MKPEKQKIKQMFFDRNGDFKLWLLLVINVWFTILVILVLLEVVR